MKEDSPNQPNNNDTYPFYARMVFEDSGTMGLQNLPSDNDKWVAFLKAHVERLKMGLGMFRICQDSSEKHKCWVLCEVWGGASSIHDFHPFSVSHSSALADLPRGFEWACRISSSSSQKKYVDTNQKELAICRNPIYRRQLPKFRLDCHGDFGVNLGPRRRTWCTFTTWCEICLSFINWLVV
jgi:hypothetical protein